MKRISLALIFALAACSAAGNPPPVPSPSPSGSPAPACGSSSLHPNHGAVVLRPRSDSAPKGGQLTYGGGPVLVHPAVYLVEWGLASSDPVARREVTFYSQVGGSDWLSTLTQYCEAPNTYIQNPTGILAGVWADSSTPPHAPTAAQIAAEARAAVPHFQGLDEANASVVVALPHGVAPVGFGSQYCAWHDSTNGLSYTNLPYMPDAGLGCGAQIGDLLAGVSIVGGHELAESITDPQPSSGWTGPGGEIGDECAWVNIQQESLNGVSFYTQPLWSNAAKACMQ